ncbi:hypothetical protein ACH3XW_17990 [Acanthocheilonema viteae]
MISSKINVLSEEQWTNHHEIFPKRWCHFSTHFQILQTVNRTNNHTQNKHFKLKSSNNWTNHQGTLPKRWSNRTKSSRSKRLSCNTQLTTVRSWLRRKSP